MGRDVLSPLGKWAGEGAVSLPKFFFWILCVKMKCFGGIMTSF